MNNEKRTLAEKLFLKEEELKQLEDYVYDQLLIALDLQYTNEDQLPFLNWVYDQYDYSFELLDVDVDWKPTQQQLNKCWEIGFKKCWITYPDVEEYYIKEISQ